MNIATLSRALRLPAAGKLPRTLHTLGTNIILIPIGIASSILIARAIGPTGKGAFDLIIATSSLMLMALGFSLPSGVTYEVARGDTNIRTLVVRLVGLAVAQTVACGVILITFVSFGQADKVLPAQHQTWWVLAIAVYLFFEMLSSHWRAILVGRQEIKKSNQSELVARLVQFLLLLGLAAALFFNGKQITIVVLFSLVLSTSILLNILLFLAVRPALEAPGSRNPIRGAISFALPCYLGNLTQFLNYRLDVFIVSALAGFASVGRYTLAVSLGQLVWLLSTSAASVLLPKVAVSESSTDVIANTNRLNRLVLCASFATAVLLGLAASQAIPILYGEAFRPSFAALVWILPGIVAFSTVNVLAAYIAGIGKPRWNLYVALVALVVTVSLDLYLIPKFDIVGASVASTASYTVSAVLTVGVYIHNTGSSLRQLLLPTSEDVCFGINLVQPLLRRVGLQRAA